MNPERYQSLLDDYIARYVPEEQQAAKEELDKLIRNVSDSICQKLIQESLGIVREGIDKALADAWRITHDTIANPPPN